MRRDLVANRVDSSARAPTGEGGILAGVTRDAAVAAVYRARAERAFRLGGTRLPPRPVGMARSSRGRATRAWRRKTRCNPTVAPTTSVDPRALSQDIFTVELMALPATESLLTLVGGEVVWDAGVLALAD